MCKQDLDRLLDDLTAEAEVEGIIQHYKGDHIMEDGKKTDVLFEDASNISVDFVVWADAGLKSVIMDVPGVTAVITVHPNKYEVILDRRWEIGAVQTAIKAAIQALDEANWGKTS